MAKSRLCSAYLRLQGRSSGHLAQSAEWRIPVFRQQLSSGSFTAGSRSLSAQTGKPASGRDPRSDPSDAEEPLPDPPSAFASMVAMGSGAVGAVAVAAVGVVGVFKMSLWVIEASGRSMTPTTAPTETEPAVVVVAPQITAIDPEASNRS